MHTESSLTPPTRFMAPLCYHRVGTPTVSTLLQDHAEDFPPGQDLRARAQARTFLCTSGHIVRLPYRTPAMLNGQSSHTFAYFHSLLEHPKTAHDSWVVLLFLSSSLSSLLPLFLHAQRLPRAKQETPQSAPHWKNNNNFWSLRQPSGLFENSCYHLLERKDVSPSSTSYFYSTTSSRPN